MRILDSGVFELDFKINSILAQIMVLFFPLIAAIPTTIAVSEGVASQQRENAGNSTSAAEEKAQMRKFNLECYCEGRGKRAREIHGRSIRLRSGKVKALFLFFLFRKM